PVYSPAAVHARALRLRRGALPRRRGHGWAPDSASALHTDRRRRPGTRRRRAAQGDFLMHVAVRGELSAFTTKDGSEIREFHHTAAQSLGEASLTPGPATPRPQPLATQENDF